MPNSFIISYEPDCSSILGLFDFDVLYALEPLQSVDHFIIHFYCSSVLKAQLGSPLCNISPPSRCYLLFLVHLQLLLDYLSLYHLFVLYIKLFDQLFRLFSFGFGFAVKLLDKELFTIGISLHCDIFLWSSQGLVVYLLKLLHHSQIIFLKGHKLSANELYFVTSLISWSQQEDKPLPLQHGQPQISQVEVNLSHRVPMVSSGVSMLSGITCRVAGEIDGPSEVRWKVLELLLDLLLASEWIVKWVSLVLLEPVRDLGV